MKFCVIGLGRLGYHVATRLAENGAETLAIDSNPAIVTSIRDNVTHAVCLRVTDEESLRSVGVHEFDTVIIAVGENLAQSILITALLKKKLHIKQVITRAINEIHKEILSLVGADQVIIPEKQAGMQLADNLTSPFTDLIRLSPNFSISKLLAPKSLINQKINDQDMYNKYQVHCIGIEKKEGIVTINPEYIISAGDKLIFSGLNTDLEKISKL